MKLYRHILWVSPIVYRNTEISYLHKKKNYLGNKQKVEEGEPPHEEQSKKVKLRATRHCSSMCQWLKLVI